MDEKRFDVVVLGAGFAGSLLSIILHRSGRRVALIERGRHPRHAIGESSTPLANLKLEVLANRYGMDWLLPFCKYGSWKQAHPEVVCGLKRGFSFFHHDEGKPFKARIGHANELLVSANPSDEKGDTHWYRADFDAMCAGRVVDEGVAYFDESKVEVARTEDGWAVTIRGHGEERTISAGFLVDATGSGQVLVDVGATSISAKGIRTESRAVYGHFENVGKWSEVLSGRGCDGSDFPFDCDAGALHHMIDGGWMWVLRFDNGVTSAGFSLDPKRYPYEGFSSGEDEWNHLLRRYPSLRRQFVRARPVRPLVRTGRLQRRLSSSSGADWAALPHAACFVDPFLSTGIAHTLYGVERLARILIETDGGEERLELLDWYASATFREMRVVDRIVSTCLSLHDRFDLMTSVSMLYFAAATHSEELIRAGRAKADDLYLVTHDESFVKIVSKVCNAAIRSDVGDGGAFVRRVQRMIKSYNSAGLCDVERANMYPYVSPSADVV
jgi:tetracycline 7-halogenase / FADH2 O2-dependent halogenase